MPSLSATARHSPLRRRLLQAAALAACLPLSACNQPPEIGGTFLQLWREHLDWPREQWLRRLTATRALGCQQVFLQWAGIDREPAESWMASDALLGNLLDDCAGLGMGVHIGVPYDSRWWEILGSGDEAAFDAFLHRTAEHAGQYMQDAPWPRHAAFRGWYLPYELEQYNWAAPVRLGKLGDWLDSLSRVAVATSSQVPTISTYYSRLPTTGTLASMWSALLDRTAVHPMIQDGVGENGIGNYDALRPLHDLFIARGTKFDLILELFESLPTGKQDGTDFKARAASFRRVQAQWEIARDYGAQRLVAFAVDPWVLGDSPEAKALLSAWQATLR